jgi:hypothetical protein
LWTGTRGETVAGPPRMSPANTRWIDSETASAADTRLRAARAAAQDPKEDVAILL